MAKYLFLDVDGVLNSLRSALGLKGVPWPEDDDAIERMDPVAVGLINRIQQRGVKIILSSSWRLEIISGRATVEEMQQRIGVKFDDITPALNQGRGLDISRYVAENLEPGDVYVIVDDDVDEMLYGQLAVVVQTDDDAGLTFEAYNNICSLLEIDT